MTVVWSWADLGDHVLNQYDIKQFYLISSVLSVKKFNPEWKRVFFVDEETYDFIDSIGLVSLWDEVKIIDFKNTEYGNLYELKLYSWPKIYTYGLIDDDILVLDIDVVFKQKFIIPDKNKVCGQFYNFSQTFNVNGVDKYVIKKFKFVKYCQCFFKKSDIDYPEISKDDICITGSPVYIPKGLGVIFQKEIINTFYKLENIADSHFQLNLSEVSWALEEEFPIAYFGKKYRGICCIDRKQYLHGFITTFTFPHIEKQMEIEKLLEISVYDDYIKNQDSKRFEYVYKKWLKENQKEEN